MIKIDTIKPKYGFLDFVEMIDTPLRVQRTDSWRRGLFINNKLVADVFIKYGGCPSNDVYIRDNKYYKEVLRVLKAWKDYYGFRKRITVTKAPEKTKSIPNHLSKS